MLVVSIYLAAEADLNDTKIPSTAGSAMSKYVFALFQQRLAGRGPEVV
jgi:hypothetical protein